MFTDIQAGLPGLFFSAVAWGDYDGDGDLDFILTGRDSASVAMTRLYRNAGGSFVDATAGAGLPDTYGSSVAWGDYDRDGDLDLAMTGTAGSRVFNNDGSGVFTDIGAVLAAAYRGSIAWGDYDNDGDLDILLFGSPSDVFRNDAGVFTALNAGLPGGCCGSSGAWGDYDNDGDLDILFGTLGPGPEHPGVWRVYRNDGSVGFHDIGAGMTGVGAATAAWGDYDNDGDLDVLLGAGLSGPSTKIYRNDGSDVFNHVATLPSAWSAAWGDYDNDGDLDVLLVGYDGGGVYRNDGAANFTPASVGLPTLGPGSVAWADYDNDGDLDFLFSGAGGGRYFSRVYRNDGAPANAPPGAPSGLSTSIGAATATFHWLPASDDHAPPVGLSYNLRLGTTPGGSDICPGMANSADGYRRVAQLGNMNERLFWTVPVSALPPFTKLYWRVQAVDGAFLGSAFSPERDYLVNVPAPSIVRRNTLGVLRNPFTGGLELELGLVRSAQVSLEILDAGGRRVAARRYGSMGSGIHRLAWNGRDGAGWDIGPGVFWARVWAGDVKLIRRVVRLQ